MRGRREPFYSILISITNISAPHPRTTLHGALVRGRVHLHQRQYHTGPCPSKVPYGGEAVPSPLPSLPLGEPCDFDRDECAEGDRDFRSFISVISSTGNTSEKQMAMMNLRGRQCQTHDEASRGSAHGDARRREEAPASCCQLRRLKRINTNAEGRQGRLPARHWQAIVKHAHFEADEPVLDRRDEAALRVGVA